MPEESSAEVVHLRAWISQLRETAFEFSDAEGTGGQQLRYEPALEGLRCLLLFAVIVGHSEEFIFDTGLDVRFTAFGSLTMFFVLSGFLVTTIVLKAKERSGSLQYRSFMARRWKRLGAPILLFLLVYIPVKIVQKEVIIRHGAVLGVIIAALTTATFTINLVPSFGYIQPYDTVSMWSLGVDMQAYMIIPIGLYFLLRYSGSVLNASLIVLGVFFLLQVTRIAEFHYFYDARASYRTISGVVALTGVYQRPENNLDAFLIGILISILWKKRLIPFELCRRLWIPAGLIFIAGMFIVKIRSPAPYFGGYLVAIVCSSILVIEALRKGSVIRRIFSSYILRLIGRFSFTAYVWHLFIFVLVNKWMKHGTGEWLRLVIAWVFLTAVTIPAWWIAERPLMRLPPVRTPTDKLM